MYHDWSPGTAIVVVSNFLADGVLGTHPHVQGCEVEAHGIHGQDDILKRAGTFHPSVHATNLC